jgi:hypothetical protein
MAALLAGASLLALPLASALDRDGPLLDYQNWNLDLSSASAQSVSYSWDHTYGPLRWPRTGRTLMTVTGSSPQYWRTSVLERFDGFRWTAAGDSAIARYELPEPASRGLTVNSQIASLDPRWVHRATFNIDALESSLVVAPGAVLKLGNLAIGSAGPAGVSLPGDQTLGDGDHYSVVAYEPDPTAQDLRGVPSHLDPGLRQYTQLALPRVAPTPVPTDSFGNPLQAGIHPNPTISLRTLAMPLYGSGGGRDDRRALARSSYGPVYALARRLTTDAKTEYGAVAAIERHLRQAYRYSESPPQRELPLRAFLFRDRRGYCQQFSGAMALMLRTLGIPARVASGFSPGVPNPDGNGWAIRDLDAHSWVEVYFNNIGWVPFDPTPAAAPAAAQSSGAGGGAGTLQHGQRRQLAGQSGGPLPLNQRLAGRTATGGGSAWPLVGGGLLVALVATAALALVRRRRLFQALAPGEAARTQARELGALVRRLELDRPEGLTLLQLERRLTTIAGPSAGEYARALRRARFGRGEAPPPTLRDRRELRRAIFGHGGRHRFLAGIFALPPGAPR